MGVQAFHIILENIARNSIKHSDRLAQDRNFRLGIFLFNNRIELKKRFKSSKDLRLKETEDQVYVVLSSNADTGDAKRCSAMDGWLRGPVITSTGERDPEGWGMKEMKLAAAFLANRGVDACNDERPVYIQAGTYEWKDDDCHLAYCLVVPKYHYVGVLRNE